MSLFQKLEEVAQMAHGWCGLEKAKTLAGIILATRPQIVVEIGVWSGKSLLPMALACQDVGRGKVIGIDPYKAAASVKGQKGEHLTWWNNQANHDAMFQLCTTMLAKYQVHAELWVKPSDDCDVPLGIGLLHVDGNHSEQGLRDVQRFSAGVVPGGFVVLDDLHWDGGAISEAMTWLVSNGFRELFSVVKPPTDDWGVFQKL